MSKIVTIDYGYNGTRIKCGRMCILCSGFDVADVANAATFLAQSAVKPGDLYNLSEYEFQVDPSGLGVGLFNLLQHRGYKVVDLRKVGMVPIEAATPGSGYRSVEVAAARSKQLAEAGYSSVNLNTGLVTVEDVQKIKAEVLNPPRKIVYQKELLDMTRMPLPASEDWHPNDGVSVDDLNQMYGRFYVEPKKPKPVELEATDEPITVSLVQSREEGTTLFNPEPSKDWLAVLDHVHEWMVCSTALAECVLMLECRCCGKHGVVKDPNSEEWKRAFRAPSESYRWNDDSRVTIR